MTFRTHSDTHIFLQLFSCIFKPKNTPQKWLFLLRFFAYLPIFLYLCDAFGDASRVKAAAQHSSSELGSAFALHFTCHCQ